MTGHVISRPGQQLINHGQPSTSPQINSAGMYYSIVSSSLRFVDTIFQEGAARSESGDKRTKHSIHSIVHIKGVSE